MMTKDELKAIRGRADAASPGPWRHESYLSGTENVTCRKAFPGTPRNPDYSDANGYLHLWSMLHNAEPFEAKGEQYKDLLREKHANAAFTAAARSDVPRLVDEVEKLQRIAEAADLVALTIAAARCDVCCAPEWGRLRAMREAIEAWRGGE